MHMLVTGILERHLKEKLTWDIQINVFGLVAIICNCGRMHSISSGCAQLWYRVYLLRYYEGGKFGELSKLSIIHQTKTSN